MKRIIQYFGILFALLSMTSCAHRQFQFPEVAIPPERIVQQGYSFVPLNEPEWLILGRTARQLAFARSGKSSDETYAIQAMTFVLPPFATSAELVRIVREGQAQDMNSKRFKLEQNEATFHPTNGAECVRTHMVVEDRAAVKRVGINNGDMILEVLTLTCAHPKDKRVGIGFIYSQRYYLGLQDPALEEKADSIFNSIQFSDL